MLAYTIFSRLNYELTTISGYLQMNDAMCQPKLLVEAIYLDAFLSFLPSPHLDLPLKMPPIGW